MHKPDPIPYIFRIGVTGHRELKDENAIYTVVENTLDVIRKTLVKANSKPFFSLIYPKNFWQRIENLLMWLIKLVLALFYTKEEKKASERLTEIKWVVISSLAKGSDQIVAQVAIDHMEARLDAIIPFEVEEYCKDFSTKSDLSAFNNLLQKASSCNIPEKGEQKLRPSAYMNAGENVVEACELLIAIWDGLPARGKGGTEEVIEYALSLSRIVVWINALDPQKPVCIITSIEKGEEFGQLKIKTKPLIGIISIVAPQFMLLASYNRDIAFRESGYQNAYKENYNLLADSSAKAKLSENRLQSLKDIILPNYAMADHLAIHYQKRHVHSATWLYALTTIAVLISILQALYLPLQTNWIVLEMLALVIAVSWYRFGACEKWHEKWLNYRHIAEQLRMLIFRSLIQLPSEKRKENQTLLFYPGPGRWMKEVYNYVQGNVPQHTTNPDEVQQIKDFILYALIKDQSSYHTANAIDKGKKGKREHNFVSVLFGITLIAVAIHFLNFIEIEWVEKLVTTLAVIMPALAASVHAISSVRDYERVATRSFRMKEVLNQMERNIDKVSTIEELHVETQKLFDIMSAENQEWNVSLSFRRIGLPV